MEKFIDGKQSHEFGRIGIQQIKPFIVYMRTIFELCHHRPEDAPIPIAHQLAVYDQLKSEHTVAKDRANEQAKSTTIVQEPQPLPPPDQDRNMVQENFYRIRIRAIAERAVSTLKTWKVLTMLPCCPHRAAILVQAILVLQLVENHRYSR